MKRMDMLKEVSQRQISTGARKSAGIQGLTKLIDEILKIK